MELTHPWLMFDKTSSNLDELIKVLDEPSDSDKGKKLRCRRCRQVITDEGQRISINGSHTHARTNPNGIDFLFECFRQAPGCAETGQATAEHTWFSGYHWRIAVCKSCGEHLGWLFTGESGFYGLIKERLIPGDD